MLPNCLPTRPYQFTFPSIPALSHPSTNQAWHCLASKIRWNWAHSGWYGHRQYLLSHQNEYCYHCLNVCQFGKLLSCLLSWLPEQLITLSYLLFIIIFLLWNAFLYPLVVFLLEIFLFLSYWFVDLFGAMDHNPLIFFVPYKYCVPLCCCYFPLFDGVSHVEYWVYTINYVGLFPAQILASISWLKNTS